MVKAILIVLLIVTVISFIIGLIVTIYEDKHKKKSNIIFTMDRDYSKVRGNVNNNSVSLISLQRPRTQDVIIPSIIGESNTINDINSTVLNNQDISSNVGNFPPFINNNVFLESDINNSSLGTSVISPVIVEKDIINNENNPVISNNVDIPKVEENIELVITPVNSLDNVDEINNSDNNIEELEDVEVL